MTTGGGLLDKLSGQTAIQVWTDSRLRAVGVGGARPTQAQATILDNKNPAYRRANPLAILGAADISAPDDVAKTGSSCWIKLSSKTIDGLQLAFRTPHTRVSRADPSDNAHARIIGISWDGGFLDGVKIRFNESLNVLIGGRGSGKSTVIESIRYALEIPPLVGTARQQHEAMVRFVLGAGTKILLELQVRRPSPSTYTVERLIGRRPVVHDAAGALLHSAPSVACR